MNALDQLTINAFQLALDRLEAPLPDAIVQQLRHYQANWVAHVDELEPLAEQFPPLAQAYHQARLELQSGAADRKQFLEHGFPANGVNGTLVFVPHYGEAVPQTPDASIPQPIKPEPPTGIPTPPSPPSSIPFAKEKILKTLEKSHLTGQDLTYTLNQSPQQTTEILRTLWQKGYIDELSAALPYILFPGLRSSRYRNSLPAADTLLTLTAKGYFHLYPLIKRHDRMVSA
jgi:hypothetical protein